MTEKQISHIKESLSTTIRKIEKIRDNLSIDNIGLFKIEVNQNRDLEPIYHGFYAVGFEQMSGDILSLKIEDKTNLGKIFS